MKWNAIALLALLLLVSLGFNAWAASTSSSHFRVGSRWITVTVNGDTVTLDGQDTGQPSPVKFAQVYGEQLTEGNGLTTDTSKHLLRVQEANGTVFIDLVSAANITSLSTRVAAMNLSAGGHPAPAKDLIDTRALVAAGGS